MAERDKETEQREPEQTPPQEADTRQKSLFETAREIEEKEKQERLAQQKRQAEAEEAARAEYSQKLAQEKLELIRLKQGVIDESETIHETPVEQKHYTLRQKIGNFFYHNKWWLGMGAFFVGLAIFLTVDYFNQENPDIVLLLLADDAALGMKTEEIADYFERYTDDVNGDGEVLVNVYYIPVSDETAYADSANSTKLMVEYHSDTAMMVIGNSNSVQTLVPEQTLTDLSTYFPDNPLVDGYAFDLTKTDFAQKVGCTEAPDDLYLGIRAVQPRSYATVEEMQKSFDKSYPVLEKVIDALTPAEAE